MCDELKIFADLNPQLMILRKIFEETFHRKAHRRRSKKRFKANRVILDFPRNGSQAPMRKHIFHDATIQGWNGMKRNGPVGGPRRCLALSRVSTDSDGGLSFSRLIKPSHLVPVNALWLADEVPDDNRSWQARYGCASYPRLRPRASDSATQSTSGERWVMSRVRVLLNSPINRARFPSPRTTWLLRLLVLAILRSPSPSVFSPSLLLLLLLHLIFSSFSSTVLSGSRRRGPFLFYHCALRFSLSRATTIPRHFVFR